MPQDRQGFVHKFRVGNFKCYLNVGMYPDGKPGEVQITADKVGTTMNGILAAFAISLSIGLQSGVPISRYIEKFKGMSFEPLGRTNSTDRRLMHVNSIMDYIARLLEIRFVHKEQLTLDGVGNDAEVQES